MTVEAGKGSTTAAVVLSVNRHRQNEAGCVVSCRNVGLVAAIEETGLAD